MFRLLVLGLLALGGPALAQDDGLHLFGGDAFGSGATVTMAREGVGDVFGAGERVEVVAPISGSAHLAGRRVATEAAIGGDVVAFGADVELAGEVAGSVTVAGYDVGIDGAVGGNVRAAGRSVSIAGPVGGSLLASGGTLVLDGTVAGDASLDAGTIVFGPAAQVGGTLLLQGPEAETLAVPGSVAPPERIARHPERHGSATGAGTGTVVGHAGAEAAGGPGWRAAAIGFALGILVLAALAFVVAVAGPRRAETVAGQIGAEPVWTVWIGFLTLSVLLGAAVVAMLTVVGLLAVPLILIVAGVACFLGYLYAVYGIGRAVWTRFDRVPPDTAGERAIAALCGALAVSLLGLVPFVGWPLLLLLTLAGLGALSIATVRPEFRR